VFFACCSEGVEVLRAFGLGRMLSRRKSISPKVVLVMNEGMLYVQNWMPSVDSRAQTRSLARN
jgi:hypothetical protein